MRRIWDVAWRIEWIESHSFITRIWPVKHNYFFGNVTIYVMKYDSRRQAIAAMPAAAAVFISL